MCCFLGLPRPINKKTMPTKPNIYFGLIWSLGRTLSNLGIGFLAFFALLPCKAKGLNMSIPPLGTPTFLGWIESNSKFLGWSGYSSVQMTRKSQKLIYQTLLGFRIIKTIFKNGLFHWCHLAYLILFWWFWSRVRVCNPNLDFFWSFRHKIIQII